MTVRPGPSGPVRVEADLYPFVKRHFEACGLTVRGEVLECDAIASDGTSVFAIEMKLKFGLDVIYQAMERMTSSDSVYIVVAVPEGNKARSNWDARLPSATRMCRMLGFGLLSVRDGLLVIECEPTPYAPRKQPKMRARLLTEFLGRTGDYNIGGTTKRPKLTAYRERALDCARTILDAGRSMSPAELRLATRHDSAPGILRGNPYLWFEKTGHAAYGVTDLGRKAVEEVYADVVAARAAIAAAAATAALPQAQACGIPR